MISDTIQKQIREAMKAKDEVRLSTLKLLSAALTNAEIEKKREKLTEEEEIKIVNSEAKKRSDAIALYEKAGRQELVDREKEELKILQEFLPEQMSEEKLASLVEQGIAEVGATGIADLGKVMSAVMPKVKGQADGNRVSNIVRQKLS